MFAALFVVASVVAFVFLALWRHAADDTAFYRAEYKKAWTIVAKYADKERLDAKIAKDRIDFDARIQKELKARADALGEALKASCHNYNEGQAAQAELDQLRDRVERASHVLSGVQIKPMESPKGWDVLKVSAK